jgi:diguanylate cyclase (GGDEF)-like protein/PAS domain S-box-containing protein
MRQSKRTKSPEIGGLSLQLHGGDDLLRNFVENSPVPTFLTGTDGRLLYANRAFGDLLGYTAADVAKLGIRQIVHPEDLGRAREQTKALAAGETQRYGAERRYIKKNGDFVWVIVSALPVLDKENGAPRFITVQAVDIDRQKRAEAALADSERRWNFALEGAGQGVWDHDLKNGRVFYSRMWRMMRGFGLDEEIDGSREAWLARVHPEDRDRIRNESIRQDSGQLKMNSFEYRERHRDGHYIWILSRGRPIEWMPDGSVARIIGTDTDITSIKLEEARAAAEAAETYRQHLAALERAHEATEAAHQLAQSLARHDALTDLPNRRVFAEALDAAIARAKRGSASFAVLSIDLDRFKPVNDLYGHATGDAVLCEVAKRLRAVVRQTDTLARVGGDEFGVILEMSASSEDSTRAAIYLASRIIEHIQRPIDVGEERRVEVGASIGIALCPANGLDSDALLRAADMAMYRAKEDGRGKSCFFLQSMETDLLARTELEEDVRHAVSSEDIHPYYQPLIRLTDEHLVGFEVLARWHHPLRGDVPPDTFIPVVERLGMIDQFTYSLLRRACLDARRWPQEITIAINVSPLHFRNHLLPVKFLAILSETGFPPSRLEIEITESALIGDIPGARAILTALQDVGIKISLDDFGTGYSSLYNLRELRFDKIKIDRAFVSSMISDADRSKIVHSVLALAKSLGMPTVAEGIEQLQTMRALAQSGAEYGQGFYFGKAMTAEDADRLIQRKSASADQRQA